jgi:hypothetical protein
MAEDNEGAEMMEVKELGKIERRMGRPHARRILIVAAIVLILGIGIIFLAKLVS